MSETQQEGSTENQEPSNTNVGENARSGLEPKNEDNDYEGPSGDQTAADDDNTPDASSND